MKRSNVLSICLLSGAVWAAAAKADESTTAASPYGTIAARNVFALAPLEIPSIPDTPAPQLPKLLPDGVMTILGRAQVLFKVVTLENSPGVQTKSASYIMAEGEQACDVEVIHIDMINRTVTFNNHGTLQEIPLTNVQTGATGNKPPPTPSQVLFNLSNRG